jgi:uncharacterized protein (TIGR00369 family)
MATNDSAQAARLLQRMEQRMGGFATALGLHIVDFEPTRVAAWADLGPTHHTPWGIVHGGTYTTAFETLASMGASLAVADRGQLAVGVNNSTDFIRSHVQGRVTMVAEPLHQGRVQQLWEVRATREEDGKLLARGQVRLQNIVAER